MRLVEHRLFGEGDRHLRLKLRDGGAVWEAVAFGMGDRVGELAPRLDLVYSVGVDGWGGNNLLQLSVKDFSPSVASR
ncbi:MAG: recJ [Dehalococcoidia bacterium]|nr:recJ [Dehalococcoidia bacterium]